MTNGFLKLLEEGRFFEIQRSLKPRDDLKDKVLSFSGSLRPHYNPNMVLLLTHPPESSGKIYEFRLEDILYAQDLPSIIRPGGVTVEKTRLWVRRVSTAMRMQPFRVGNSNEKEPRAE